MNKLFLCFILLLVACSDNNAQIKFDDKLLTDTGHNIKEDSSTIKKHHNTILCTGWYYIVDVESGFKRQLDKSSDTFFIYPKPIVIAANFTKLEIYESNESEEKYIGMTMRLDEIGTENWSVATGKSIGKQLAFILDNRLLYVAKVNSQITAGITALNRGGYSRVELDNFKKIIESEK
ncbi:MAG: hypothetical protein ABL940_03385 [Bacteroidia bacterium]